MKLQRCSLSCLVPPKAAFALLPVFLAGAILSPSLRADLIVNGGFESGDFTGWTVSVSDPTFTYVGSLSTGDVPNTGVYTAVLGEFLSDGFLSQSFLTIPGQQYGLSFWLQNDGSSPNHFSVSWDGGSPLVEFLDVDNGFDYTQFVFTGLVASSSSTTLSFAFENDSAFWHLDDVSVVTPEPIGLLPAGVAIIGASLWRIRRRGTRT